jgi:glucose/arabinose dehydrogenase
MNRTAAILPLALALAGCGEGPRLVRDADARPARSTRAAAPSTAPTSPRCDPDNGGITLPAGFCATIFAIVREGSPRHIAVAPNGDVFAALEGRLSRGGVLALRDTDGDGKADRRELFSSRHGSGIAVSGGWLYFARNDEVLRWRLAPGRLAPAGEGETIVRGLPAGGHAAKTIALDGRGALFVNVGSRTNACQARDRQAGGAGLDPCPELATRAGIWRFDAARAGQTQATGERWATGIRNAMGITVAPGGQLFATQHGRDQLHQNWPELFDVRKSAENPGEELLAVNRGDDFGWPYCFYDVDLRRRVLAPEYGGRGTEVGRCARTKAPVLAFPGHWAPESLVFYTGTQFPARYRGGAFVAFHGSWNRAPLPQAGYRVEFVPASGRGLGPRYEAFAGGFARNPPVPGTGRRPMGLAVGPDGSLYVSDDGGGVIWRVMWRGR